MNRLPSIQKNSTVIREHDPRALARLIVLLTSGIFLACGFVFAAQRHFDAVRFGYQSEELRREHTRLLEDQRRLMLIREQASTPERLQAAARELGLQPLQAAQIEVMKRNGDKPERPNAIVEKSSSKANVKRY
jgi:hypothetical protein